MRLFVAINLPGELKDDLFSLQTKVKEAKITWVAKKHLHLTLKFIGDIPDEKIEEIKSRILDIKTSKFSIKLGELGFFKNNKISDIFWVSVIPKENVIALQQKVDEVLLDLVSSEQKFVSHITLGRIKQVRRQKDFEKSIKEIVLPDKEYLIESFSVFSSVLTGKGPIYEELEHVKMS